MYVTLGGSHEAGVAGMEQSEWEKGGAGGRSPGSWGGGGQGRASGPTVRKWAFPFPLTEREPFQSHDRGTA